MFDYVVDTNLIIAIQRNQEHGLNTVKGFPKDFET